MCRTVRQAGQVRAGLAQSPAFSAFSGAPRAVGQASSRCRPPPSTATTGRATRSPGALSVRSRVLSLHARASLTFGLRRTRAEKERLDAEMKTLGEFGLRCVRERAERALRRLPALPALASCLPQSLTLCSSSNRAKREVRPRSTRSRGRRSGLAAPNPSSSRLGTSLAASAPLRLCGCLLHSSPPRVSPRFAATDLARADVSVQDPHCRAHAAYHGREGPQAHLRGRGAAAPHVPLRPAGAPRARSQAAAVGAERSRGCRVFGLWPLPTPPGRCCASAMRPCAAHAAG